GVLRVKREENSGSDNGPLHKLIHGSIQHGFQYLDPDKKSWPTTYYGPPSGVGLAIEHHPRRSAVNPDDRALVIGVVGLGCGTLAAYGQQRDYLRFYEINPEVIRLSDKYFTYCKDTPAKVDVVLGDARIKLEQELAEGKGQEFDVLVIDAFSSDSIPMHLLTTQSVELYFEHLKPDGLLCIHISNRFLDLAGVVMGIARELGYPCVMIDTGDDDSQGLNVASWVILTRNWDFLADAIVVDVSRPCWPVQGDPVVWTDDYGSLWQVIATE
ncbi:MAG: fused MFS/spermidine synthase, partial [Planctomycetes bacterium]|nr:fused MFS/spermidine synthase [Planctomycetota bacterium]